MQFLTHSEQQNIFSPSLLNNAAGNQFNLAVPKTYPYFSVLLPVISIFRRSQFNSTTTKYNFTNAIGSVTNLRPLVPIQGSISARMLRTTAVPNNKNSSPTKVHNTNRHPHDPISKMSNSTTISPVRMTADQVISNVLNNSSIENEAQNSRLTHESHEFILTSSAERGVHDFSAFSNVFKQSFAIAGGYASHNVAQEKQNTTYQKE